MGGRFPAHILSAIAAAAMTLVVVALPSLAWGVGEGIVYVSLGIVEYSEGNYREAIAYLEKARQLAPKDVSALYYLGLAHNAVGDNATGLRFLEEAKQLDPENIDVRFQLGVALLTQHAYAKAEPEFQFVFARNSRHENVGYYLGYITFQRRDYQQALTLLRQNVSTDPQFRQLAEFYAGLALARQGQAEEATRHLVLAAQAAPSTRLAGTAERLARGTEAAAREDRRFRLEMKVALLGDDNVILAPTAGVQGVDLRSPGNLFYLRGDYDVIRNGNWRATLSYSLLQTVYHFVDSFNLRDQMGELSVSYTNTARGMRYFTGLQYGYEYLTLGEQAFLQRHSVGPYLAWEWNPMHFTQFQHRLQVKDFDAWSPFRDEERDAVNNLVGLTHFLRFQQDRHYIKLGYAYDHEAALGHNWRYQGHKALGGFQMSLPWWDVRLRGDAELYWRDYPGNNSTFAAKRRDFEQLYQVSLAKDLPRNFTVSLEYLLDRNDSKIFLFDYIRQVFLLAITWRPAF